MDLVLLIGFPALLGAGYLSWNFWFKHDIPRQPEAQSRRREDARDWQRRFGADSLLAANFLQPTQNEILETLYLLDYLTPGWDAGAFDEAERYFLDELASSFPTLRKAACAFPLPFVESQPDISSLAKASSIPPVREKDIAAKREAFRVARAHSNALEQIASRPTGPKVATPGSLPFAVSNVESDRRRGSSWPVRLAGATVLGMVVFGVIHLLPNGAVSKTPPMQQEAKQPIGKETPDAVESSPTDKVTEPDEPAASVPPAPTLAVAAASARPSTLPTPPPPATPDPQKAVLNQQIAASKQRALGKYPSLATEGSEINLRFVFRYKALIQQNSPRLLDPNWPEKLAEECAADSTSSLKHSAFTQVFATQH